MKSKGKSRKGFGNAPINLINLNWGLRETMADETSIPSDHKAFGLPDSTYNLDLVVPPGKAGNAFWEGIQIMMNELRAASGSNITYTTLDLGAYVLNIRELMAAMAVVRRSILALRIVDPYDAQAPIKYVQMMESGISTDDYGEQIAPSVWQDEVADTATNTVEYNRLAGVVEAYTPVKIPFVERGVYLFENVFTDSPSEKFSAKIFRPIWQGAYWEVNDEGKVVRNVISLGGGHSTKRRLQAVEQILSTMAQYDQNSRIAGDILKAYGQAAFLSVPRITPESKVHFLYDEQILTQIKNCSIIPGFSAGLAGITTQPGSTVIASTAIHPTHAQGTGSDFDSQGLPITSSYASDDVLVAAWIGRAQNKVVTTPKNSVSPADALSATALVAFCDVSASSSPGYLDLVITQCGTEIVRGLTWWTGYNPATDEWHALPAPTRTIDIGYSASVVTSFTLALTAVLWSRDDWSPEIPLTSGLAAHPGFTMFDLDNHAIMTREQKEDFAAHSVTSLMASPAFLVEQQGFRFTA